MLFPEIVFGPIQSRRLGCSLGINLLPTNIKVCTMNCIYCECGWNVNNSGSQHKLPSKKEVFEAMKTHFRLLQKKGTTLDSITFSGNGEPTLHTDFASIVDRLIYLRDRLFSKTTITCLSNSTQLHRTDVLDALRKINQPMMKLDAGSQTMFDKINQTHPKVDIDTICKKLKCFDGNLIIQSMFLRGFLDDGTAIDNTIPMEVDSWVDRIKDIHPHTVVLYSIDRIPPSKSLEKVATKDLNLIAEKLRPWIPKVEVY